LPLFGLGRCIEGLLGAMQFRDALGITPGKQLSLKFVDDHLEVRPLMA
jgi:hypothetical protein